MQKVNGRLAVQVTIEDGGVEHSHRYLSNTSFLISNDEDIYLTDTDFERPSSRTPVHPISHWTHKSHIFQKAIPQL